VKSLFLLTESDGRSFDVDVKELKEEQLVPLFVLDKSMVQNMCLQHPCFKNL
jgi:hypothetical protein